MKSLNLQTKMIFLITSLLVFMLVFLGFLFNNMLSSSLEDQIGKRALNVAQSVARMPTVQDAFQTDDPSAIIQPIVEEIRKETNAQFIVVGNREEIRYSHPLKERIGQKMAGGDSHPALEKGESYVSKAVGSLGPSIRGKVPIINKSGEVIGIVSVGFLLENVQEIIYDYQWKVYLFIFTVLLIGVIAAVQIAKGFKKAIFGLEPKEIASLLLERNAILESIREGIIAINEKGYITMINKEACRIINIPSHEKVVGKRIVDVFPSTKMVNVLQTGDSDFDEELLIGKKEVIVNRTPIINNGSIDGVVASFRRKDEIDQLSKELSQVQSYAESLRAQTHEYSNKLYTISGLIQLGSYEEAIELIHKETADYQEIVQFLMTKVPDTMIAALFLGKYNRAHELKIEMEIDSESSMKDIPIQISREKLVTILGNLLDNAFESVLESAEKEKRVQMFMTDLGRDLIFEIEDSGSGVSDKDVFLIFQRGYSTKKKEGGVGLFLVDSAVRFLGGYITVSKSSLGGALFTVVIPKERKEEDVSY
jgi:two-component system, CitB family, sensor kinase